MYQSKLNNYKPDKQIGHSSESLKAADLLLYFFFLFSEFIIIIVYFQHNKLHSNKKKLIKFILVPWLTMLRAAESCIKFLFFYQETPLILWGNILHEDFSLLEANTHEILNIF